MVQYDINLREYSRILKKRKFTVIFTALLLGTFSTFLAYMKAPIPLYTTDCSIKFEKQTTVEGLYAKTMSWSTADDIETQIAVLKSYSVMKEVAENLGLIPKEATKKNSPLNPKVTAIVDALQSKVGVSREAFTNIINIGVTDTDPAFAQRLANGIAFTFKQMHARQQSKRTADAVKYISSELKRVRKNLREAEDEFNRFTRKNQLVSIDLQSEALLSSAKKLKDEIRKLGEARTELRELLEKLGQFLKDPLSSDNNFYSGHANRQYQATNDRLIELLLKRDSLLEDYTPRHPEVIAIERQTIENARKMRLLLQLQINGIENRQADLRKQLATVDKKTNELMEKKLEFERLKRKVDSFNDMTALLEKKNQEALIREAERPEEVTIVRPALLPTSPINPPKTVAKGATGMAIGLVLGLIIAFIVETFDTSLGAIEDVEETLGTQVLGVIPHADIKDILEGQKPKDQKDSEVSPFRERLELISHFGPRTMLAESFRALRTNISFRDLEKKVKTMAITAASPEEGKSTVCVNLAITMAQAGIKTLLVGCDLRKPVISRIFGVERTPGLTEVLLGNYSWQDATRGITDLMMGKMGMDDVMVTPGLDNLHIITSGATPPNPAELIDSNRLGEFVEEVRAEHDIAIFDSPPILSTTDPLILGSKLDAVLLVYRVGSISRALLRRAAGQLSQVNCNLLGVVLNDMKAEVSPDFQGYKYYKSYYSYAEKAEKKEGNIFKRAFSFIRKKADNYRKETPSKEEGKRPKRLGILIMLLALAFFVGGILWQMALSTRSKEPPRRETTNKVKKSIPRTISSTKQF